MFIVTHGGVGAPDDWKDGPQAAAEAGWKILESGGGALNAAVEAAVMLEDDPRFNAGTGSRFRIDGKTVEMDASVMDSAGKAGAVIAIRAVKNPVRVALAVTKTPHITLCGEGALEFARTLGFGPHDPSTEKTREFIATAISKLKEGKVSAYNQRWVDFIKEYPALEKDGGCDTIGAVASDGAGGFAAANSTGGTALMLKGRVGDSPIFGAGLWVGKAGAVATTGIGEHIVRGMVALEVYRKIAWGVPAAYAVQWGLDLVPEGISLGIIAVDAFGWGSAANGPLPVGVRER